MTLHTFQHKSPRQVYLRVSLGDHQLLSNYSEFGRHGYSAIHGTSFTVYITNASGYCNLIGSTIVGSSTSTIYYSHVPDPYSKGEEESAARLTPHTHTSAHHHTQTHVLAHVQLPIVSHKFEHK